MQTTLKGGTHLSPVKSDSTAHAVIIIFHARSQKFVRAANNFLGVAQPPVFSFCGKSKDT